jgi:hypothetical protein
MKDLVDAAIHSEHGKVIKNNFKPGSLERSTDFDREGMPQQQRRLISVSASQ